LLNKQAILFTKQSAGSSYGVKMLPLAGVSYGPQPDTLFKAT